MVEAHFGRGSWRSRRYSRFRSLEGLAGLARRAEETHGFFTRIKERTGTASSDEVAQNEGHAQTLIGSFLTVRVCDVLIKCSLQSLDVFSLLRTVMRRCRMEERRRTQRATALDGNISQPFGDSQYTFLHGPTCR